MRPNQGVSFHGAGETEVRVQEVRRTCDGGEQQQQVDRVYLLRVAGAKVCRCYLARPFWPHTVGLTLTVPSRQQ